MYFDPLNGSFNFSPGALVRLQDDKMTIKNNGK